MHRIAMGKLATAVATALAVTTVSAATAVAAPSAPSTTSASPSAGADASFYTYDGSTPLASYAPGAVLKTRTLQYHVLGIPTPVQAVQLLFRTVDAQGRPSAGVTSIVRSPNGDHGKAVSYQSFYDSLNPADSPSRAIAGDVSLGGLIANGESLLLAPLLLSGYNVIIPDSEGQNADFAAGPEYGTNTLDSIRAASQSPATGLNADTRIGLAGYSGGAIATHWAAVLAPSYAPDVDKRLVGYAEGGLLVDPAHNLKYVSGSSVWAGVAPMAVLGAARSYDIDFTPYLNGYGQQVFKKLEHGSIVNALGQYPGLTWKQMVKPEYANPNSVPAFVEAVNKLNLGSAATPNAPGFIVQGNGGVFEGTFSNLPGIGRGDGVMVAGDVRALVRQYCDKGNTAVKYQQYELLSHVGAAVPWAPAALGWLGDRFAGKTPPSDCGRIPAGNSLAPEVPTTRP
ncbi:lipase family protein [Streptomyces sp. NBC_00536]|uniref:lipase family protein n=1 Tax=Streptomyces sp. NBC_00536 TaxID=2975769 RepID=UPI002E82281C|nr:lipase family protein [Streptomyces sp. NBC_00536]WUC76984.1 lipase family protein [Streptomyces sp. NBC_00536]